MYRLLLAVSVFAIIQAAMPGAKAQSSRFGKWVTVTDSIAAVNLKSVCMLTPQKGVAVGSTGVVMLTSDGGQSWLARRLDSTIDLYGVASYDSSHVVCVGSQGAAFLSTNAGLTWAKRKTYTPKTLRAVAFFGAIDGVQMGMAVGDAGEILQTGDGGSNWDEVPIYQWHGYPVGTGDTLTSIAISKYFNSGVAVAKSGKTIGFQTVTLGGPLEYYGSQVARGVDRVQFIEPNTFVVSGGNWGLYSSKDLGFSWIAQKIDSANSTLHPRVNTFCGFSDSVNGFFVVPGVEGTPFWGQYVTTDGGAKWDAMPNSDFSTYKICGIDYLPNCPSMRGFAYPDSTHVIGVGDFGLIMTSTDKGRTWAPVQYCPDCYGHLTQGLSFSNERDGFRFYYPNQSYKSIDRTTDGGWTWTQVYKDSTLTQSYFRSISSAKPKTCFITSDSGHIFSTQDGGIHWSQQQLESLRGAQTEWRVSMWDSLNGFVIAPYQVFSTTNGGVLWDTVSIDPSLDGAFYRDVISVSSHSCALMIAMPEDTIYSTFAWCNRIGNKWSVKHNAFATFGLLNKMSFADSMHGWIVGGTWDDFKSKIARTTNGGATWALVRDTADSLRLRVQGNPVLVGVAFADTNNGIACGASNLILRTTDGGTTWIQQDDGLSITTDYASDQIAFPSVHMALISGFPNFLLRYSGDNIQTSVVKNDPMLPSSTFLQVYPSPTRGPLNVLTNQATLSRLSITDVLGRIVLTKSVAENEITAGMQIDISTLSAGVYVLQIRSGSTNTFSKFTKQ